MKNFLIKTVRFALVFIIPLMILLFLYLILDPFKVINSYDSFYDENAKGWVGINKDYVSTTTFVNNYRKKKIDYNSFIFGNSRSIFYQVDEWKKYLSPGSNCFHFDASTEALWALNKKIEFIDKQGVKIENALLVLDYATLIQDKPKTGHLFIITPQLVDNTNIIDFHLAFFRAFLSLKFLYAYADYKISGEIKPYMKKGNLLGDSPRNYDPNINEIKYNYYEDLIKKNKYYTSERLSEFYKRDAIQAYSGLAIKENQKVILSNIQHIFKRHQTKVKIVISPLYDQVKFNQADFNYLVSLFGKKSVFDFSGINKFTTDYKNYYESSHYRPLVAKELLQEIYKTE